MAAHLFIENDGPEILSTNFWQSALARAGTFYLSTNAGAFRLLVPTQHQGSLREMRRAHTCIVSRGPWPAQRLPEALELLFDDGSPAPWSLHLTPRAVDLFPLARDEGRLLTLSVWLLLVGHTCTNALEKPCYYRRSLQLPDLRPWSSSREEAP